MIVYNECVDKVDIEHMSRDCFQLGDFFKVEPLVVSYCNSRLFDRFEMVLLVCM